MDPVESAASAMAIAARAGARYSFDGRCASCGSAETGVVSAQHAGCARHVRAAARMGDALNLEVTES